MNQTRTSLALQEILGTQVFDWEFHSNCSSTILRTELYEEVPVDGMITAGIDFCTLVKLDTYSDERKYGSLRVVDGVSRYCEGFYEYRAILMPGRETSKILMAMVMDLKGNYETNT